jgi:hypothetical protein
LLLQLHWIGRERKNGGDDGLHSDNKMLRCLACCARAHLNDQVALLCSPQQSDQHHHCSIPSSQRYWLQVQKPPVSRVKKYQWIVNR